MERITFSLASGTCLRQRRSFILALCWSVALGTMTLPTAARAQDENAPPHVVRLCNISYSIKVKSFGRQLKSVNPSYLEAWQKIRPDDSSSRCRRLYAASDKKRLSKLVAIGKAEKATHLVAPTAGKSGKNIEVSFWLVDIEKAEVVGELSQSFSRKRSVLKAELPVLSQKAVEKFLPLLNAVEGTPEQQPADEEAPVADETEKPTAATTAEPPPPEETSEAAAQAPAAKEPAQAADEPAADPASVAPSVEDDKPASEDAIPPATGVTQTNDASGALETPPNTEQKTSDVPAPQKESLPEPSAAGETQASTEADPVAPAITAKPAAPAAVQPFWEGEQFLPLSAAALGGITGAGLGALVHTLAVAERNRSSDGVADLGQSIWVGTLMGAGLGALTGAWYSTTDAVEPQQEVVTP